MKTCAVLVGLVLGSGCVAQWVDGKVNRVERAHAVAPSERARNLHARIPVVDLHADALLWARDPTERQQRGHVDLERLREGNVALQVFSVVSHTPPSLRQQGNPDVGDSLVPLMMAQGWPPATWFSTFERARYQANRLQAAALASADTLRVIRTKAGLRELLRQRADGVKTVGALLALEGAYPLEDDVENLTLMHHAGLRMVGLTHFQDNSLGGSAHGWRAGGLTEKGRELVRRMEALGITLDIAHASPPLIDDVMQLVTRPVVVSHTGVQGTCPGVRNLSDAQVDAVAATGGVVGIALFKTAVCGTRVENTVDAMEYVARRVGVKHVALGSDFDGFVATPLDVSQLVEVTDALVQRGFRDDDVAMIMGGNALRVLLQNLP